MMRLLALTVESLLYFVMLRGAQHVCKGGLVINIHFSVFNHCYRVNMVVGLMVVSLPRIWREKKRLTFNILVILYIGRPSWVMGGSSRKAGNRNET